MLSALGEYILQFDERLMAHVHRTSHANPWFTIDNQKKALTVIAEQHLDRSKLEEWVGQYPAVAAPKLVGIVAAGNIPAVAFHDILAVIVSGHHAQVKLSEKDQYLIPFLVKWMSEQDERMGDLVSFVEKLEGFDAVIATGTNNSARYFEQYFGRYPNIIRRNRNAVALLTGEESETELEKLADDIFEHFGMGCRNVSHLVVPKGFDVESLRDPFESYAAIADHSKYRNNYDYNLAIAILNKEEHIALGNIILKPSDSIINRLMMEGCGTYADGVIAIVYFCVAIALAFVNIKRAGYTRYLDFLVLRTCIHPLRCWSCGSFLYDMG